MRSEMALAPVPFDEGGGPPSASAVGEAEPRRLNSEFDSGPRQRYVTPLQDDGRVAALLRTHFRDVWRMVRRFGVPESGADDAAQEVFIIAARRLADIAPGSERPFLLASAVRVARGFGAAIPWDARPALPDSAAQQAWSLPGLPVPA